MFGKSNSASSSKNYLDIFRLSLGNNETYLRKRIYSYISEELKNWFQQSDIISK